MMIEKLVKLPRLNNAMVTVWISFHFNEIFELTQKIDFDIVVVHDYEKKLVKLPGYNNG